MNEFSIWLLDQMCSHNMTQNDLAAVVGLTQPEISRHASGKVKPRYKTVKKYCDYFGEKNIFEIYELSLN